MRPLPRNLLIGLLVSACVAGALAATWWTAQRPEDSLAAHLPADAVLAYAEFPVGKTPDAELLARISPAVPSLPRDVATDATAAAAVILADGTTGWITMRHDDRGEAHIEGTHPDFATLIATGGPSSLASDRTFADLRFAEPGWTYVAELGEGSVLAGAFDDEQAAAYRWHDGRLTLRLPLRPTPALARWSGRPLATIPGADTFLLPPAHALPRLGTQLSADARLIAETVASTFVDGVARGLSLRYDLPLLLDGPSLVHVGSGSGGATVFALEGRGATAPDVDRLLRLAHDRFAAANGGASEKTVTAEGFTLTTLTPDVGADTVETKDGAWTILRTAAGDAELASAHDGARFVLTTAPDALHTRADGADSPTGTSSLDHTASLAWTDALAERLRPLWPTLRPLQDRLTVLVTQGPGFVEWAMGPLQSL